MISPTTLTLISTKNMKKILYSALFVSFLVPFASAFSLSDIQNWTGTGTNEAALVVDFQDGSTYPAFVWGYRWDGTQTGEQMVQAIVSANSNLTTHITSYSFGDALDEYRYDGTSFGLGLHDQVGFGTSTTGYWAYSNGSGVTMPTSTTWISSAVGFGSWTLTNQDWEGWSWAPGFNAVPPTQNVIAAPEAVPSPPGAYLLAGGYFGLAYAVKRKR